MLPSFFKLSINCPANAKRTCRSRTATALPPPLTQTGTTRDRATGANPGHQRINPSCTVAPDLLRCGAFMHSWIGWVIELLQQIGPGDFSLKLFRQGNGASHSLSTIGELQLGSIGPEHRSPLGAHRVRHRED